MHHPIECAPQFSPPRVFIENGAKEKGWSIDDEKLADHMAHDYRLSAEQIASTAIVISANNRFAYLGSAAPKTLDRLIHGKSLINEGDGLVVMLTTRLKGKDRTPAEVNETLAHELEHVAQAARGDRSYGIGNVAVWGLTLAGAITGNYVGKSRVGRLGGLIVGGVVGQQLGHQIAPHELEAQQAAKKFELSVVQRHGA